MLKLVVSILFIGSVPNLLYRNQSIHADFNAPRFLMGFHIMLEIEQLFQQLKHILQSRESNTDPVGDLRLQSITSPLVLVGTQKIRIERSITYLKDYFFNGKLVRYSGSDFTSQAKWKALSGELALPSLFSPYSFVVLQNADKIKASMADDLVTLLRGNSKVFLVLVVEKYNKRSAVFSRLAKLNPTIVKVPDLKGKESMRWVAQEAVRIGCKGIEPAAIKTLLNLSNHDLDSVSRQLSLLSLQCSSSEMISQELVTRHSTVTSEVASFELFSSIVAKRLTRSIAILRKLLAQGLHPLQLSAFLSRCYRTLLANTHGRGTSTELANAWFLRQVSAHKSSLGREQLCEAIELIAKLDFELKDSKLSAELTLERAVVRLAML